MRKLTRPMQRVLLTAPESWALCTAHDFSSKEALELRDLVEIKPRLAKSMTREPLLCSWRWRLTDLGKRMRATIAAEAPS